MTDLLALITPTNLQIEKEKFISSKTYHPVFHYVWQDKVIDPTFSIKLKYPLWEAIKSQNTQQIMLAAQKLFEINIDDKTLSQSKYDSKLKGKSTSGSSADITKIFETSFKEFDLDYTVHISNETGFNIRPRHQDKQIIISQDVHFEYFSMEAEAHHELVHIIRYRNGKHNAIRRSQRFLPTEEGLASWCQDNTNNDNGLAQHAMEYIASSIGIKGSLRDVYECFRELGMSSELAWKRACRHKFGFVYTKEPGDILKPAMYYQNELKIGQLKSDEKLRLFVGKISFAELSTYPFYSGLWPASKLHDYFHL